MLLNVTNSWPVLIVFCVGLGLADGCFWVVEGPIAYDICGPSGAAQAIGFLKGLMGISFAAGPPIAGKNYLVLQFDFSKSKLKMILVKYILITRSIYFLCRCNL